ncbi:MAG: ribosome small subunit-dependent GTPase A [Oscillospiraceae bacterium]|nr:ribosome small subunit-dependent GTPase A [Oscillospiraceae bacterium]
MADGPTKTSAGVIIKALAGFYYVETDGGVLECRARGKFRREDVSPLVGDKVKLEPHGDGKGTVTEILPRKNEFSRPPVANIDVMVIVASAAPPVTDPFLIDRMAAVAELAGAEPIICLNKCDLDSADSLHGVYAGAGFRVFRVSAGTGEGTPELLRALRGLTSALTGNSGVGKSSILNALGLDIETGEVSEKLGRGRHTTRYVSLHSVDGALITDTPGFSSFDADGAALKAPEDLAPAFRDFAPYLGKCRFRDCSHTKEPGCAVLRAVELGELAASRHRSYARLYAEALDACARRYK